jgi:hypothetical protein
MVTQILVSVMIEYLVFEPTLNKPPSCLGTEISSPKLKTVIMSRRMKKPTDTNTLTTSQNTLTKHRKQYEQNKTKLPDEGSSRQDSSLILIYNALLICSELTSSSSLLQIEIGFRVPSFLSNLSTFAPDLVYIVVLSFGKQMEN